MKKLQLKYTRFEYPKEVVNIAKTRVEGLMHPNILLSASIYTLFESAYLQGFIDGSQCLGGKNTNEKTSDENSL